jgi:hypothetical protein
LMARSAMAFTAEEADLRMIFPFEPVGDGR